jgi:hypothetical protein
MAREQDLEIFALRILGLRRWPRMSCSLERLIKGGDVTGECDAGTPGSDGASPYPENVPNVS